MTKILVITESIDFNDSSGANANVGLIKSLHALGYKVRVLHYNQKKISIEGIECIEVKEIKHSLIYFLSRSQRILQRKFKIDLSRFLENIFGNSFTFFNDAKSIAKGIEKNYAQDDLIITASKGASFRPHYAMLSLPQLYEKWLAYVHDPFPFEYYPAPYKKDDKGFKFKESFFRKVSDKARYSAFPSMLLRDWMGSYFPNFLSTGIVIPHQNLSTQNFKPLEFPNYFNPNNFSLLHAGTLFKERNPEALIKGYLLFLDRNQNAIKNSSLLLLGPGSSHKKTIEDNSIKNIFWSNVRLPYKEISFIQKNTTVNIILEAVSEISPFLPGKFPHCVNADKPILLLGSSRSECRRLLGEDYQYYSEANDVPKISSIIEKLYIQWENNKSLKLDRPDLEYYFSTDYLNKKVKDILKMNNR